jgi:hypothetical protein
MNPWRTQFNEHPLHKSLEAINDLLRTTSLKTKDEVILDSFNRLIVVMQAFTRFVQALTPELTVKAYLDNLHAPLSQIIPQLTEFSKSENPVHLQSANQQADQLVQKIPPFALPETAIQHAESVNSLSGVIGKRKA